MAREGIRVDSSDYCLDCVPCDILPWAVIGPIYESGGRLPKGAAWINKPRSKSRAKTCVRCGDRIGFREPDEIDAAPIAETKRAKKDYVSIARVVVEKGGSKFKPLSMPDGEPAWAYLDARGSVVRIDVPPGYARGSSHVVHEIKGGPKGSTSQGAASISSPAGPLDLPEKPDGGRQDGGSAGAGDRPPPRRKRRDPSGQGAGELRRGVRDGDGEPARTSSVGEGREVPPRRRSRKGLEAAGRGDEPHGSAELRGERDPIASVAMSLLLGGGKAAGGREVRSLGGE